MELSTRFINAYNTIDSALKEQNDLKRSLSYTESIRKAAKTNAIVRKNLDELTGYVKQFGVIDINEIGIVTILAKNFRNMISVQLSNNPTPETTGLDSKQIYAIKKIPRLYSQKQLLDIFDFLCDIDRRLKSGELPVDMMINYVMLKVLTI